MSGRKFTLTRHLDDFIERTISIGLHRNASEVVHEALRRYEDDLNTEETSLAVIQALANRGIDAIHRGEFTMVQGEGGALTLAERLNGKAAEGR